MDGDNIAVFPCSCGGEGLVVNVWREEDWPDEVCISIWRLGHRHPWWKYQLRHIWYIIKHGHPYLDDIVMTTKVARDFATRILDRTSGD